MNHDELRESSGAYVLDALTPDERREFEAHLGTCTDCAAEVRALREVAHDLARGVPQHEPSPALRARVLGIASGARTAARRAGAPWWLLAAAAVLAIGAGLYALALRARISDLESTLENALARAAAAERTIQLLRLESVPARQTVEILAASDVRRVELSGQSTAPAARGLAYWSASRGLIFSARNLPAPPAGKTYQLWVIPRGGSPVSAGLLTTDATGLATAIWNPPATVPASAIAVSLEPAGGVPAPTGAIYLIGSI